MQRTERHRGGALNVVVEGQQLVAIALEDRQRVRGGEVLPLQQHVGKLVLHRRHEFVDERVVLVVADASVTPPEVLRVLQQFDVVGTDVQHDRQGSGRVDATDQDVQRQLPDRDAHPADALIAEAEDALAVSHHDDVRVAVRAVVDHLAESLPVGVGHEEPPRASVDLAEALARLTDRRGVNDGHGLGDVVAKDPIEQGFVAVLQCAQVDVLVEIVAARGELVPAVFSLLGEGLLGGREQAQETVSVALVAGECGAFCRQRVEQLGLPRQFLGHEAVPSAGPLQQTQR